MTDTTTTTPEPMGDFAAGERIEPVPPEEIQETALGGDFAAGERTEPLTDLEEEEAGTHGDFAAGERTEPITAEEERLGDFADTEA